MDINTNVMTVIELNNMIKNILTTKLKTNLSIKGEISNMKCSNGTRYLTLKDDQSSISVVLWKANNNYISESSELTNGDSVIITGNIVCYVKSGIYQINAKNIEKINVNNIKTYYDKLKQKFQLKGYFSKHNTNNNITKRLIKRIGILTARGGAALEDILYVLNTNGYTGQIYVKNCIVQGTNCPSSVKEGIQYFNELHKTIYFDALIVGRGGGAFEDLMGFSSKEVVKAIHTSKIYIISAVGHEIDTMLSDYAADIRAPTPSIAAALISSNENTNRQIINNMLSKLEQYHTLILSNINNIGEKLNNLENKINALNPTTIIDNEITQLQSKQNKISNIINHKLEILYNKIIVMDIQNENINPAKTLKKGYVMICDISGDLIDSLDKYNNKIKSGEKLKIIFADGEVII
jgi:exodeoxyribonuclease VII large subunit